MPNTVADQFAETLAAAGVNPAPCIWRGPSDRHRRTFVSPVRRKLATNMVRTNVPMIDVFNRLVESQKIPTSRRRCGLAAGGGCCRRGSRNEHG